MANSAHPPHNPFRNHPPSPTQYPPDSLYPSPNSSTTHLASPHPFYDRSSFIFPSPSQLPDFLLASADADYSRRYTSSVDSHASIPSISPFADPGAGAFEPYPAWSTNRQIPMSTEEIEDIFLDLTQKFGFQRDSMRNMASIHFLLYF